MPLTEAQREYQREWRRQRYANDPEFREKVKARARSTHKLRYANDPEFREAKLRYQSERYANDPEFREAKKIYTRKHQRRHDLKRHFGISLDEYAAMLLAQDGHCAVCPASEETLQVDHCHVTGRVRGLLCGKCNRALGLLDDDRARIISLAEYLTQHHEGGDA